MDSAETTYGVDSCGSRLYKIIEQGDAALAAVAYARVDVINAGANFRIVSDYSLEAYEGEHNLSLYVTMENYPLSALGSHPTLLSNFKLTISKPVCDCKLLDWIMPTAQTLTTTVLKEVSDTITITHATVDPASKITTPAIRACYRSDITPVQPGCDETTAITSVVEVSNGILPGYFVRAGNVMTVSATANSQSRSYTMRVTHSTTFEDAAISYDTLTITVADCVITDIDKPTNPGAQSYNVHSLTDISLDLVSPGFVQRPACGYVLTESIAWTFNPTPAAPLIITNGEPYKLKIKSAINADAQVYTAKLTNTASY